MLTVREAADRTEISLSLIYQLCQEGRLPHHRIGGRGCRGKILIAEADLDAFVASCRVTDPIEDDGPLIHIR